MTPIPQTSTGSASYGFSQLTYNHFVNVIQEHVKMTNFWGYIWPAATQSAQQPCFSGLLALIDNRETKICDLKSSSGIEQEIFWFQVTMADTFAMDIILS